VHGRYHHGGRATPLDAGVLPQDEARRLAAALLAGTVDASQMLVHDGVVDAMRDAETALELLLPAPDSFDAGTAGRVRADRLFIPLTGPYAPAAPAAAVFAGDGGYRRGPFLHPRGRDLLAPLLARAEAAAARR
jgi:hypothetical protein